MKINKIFFIVLALSPQLSALSPSANAQQFLAMNDPVYTDDSDEEALVNAEMENSLKGMNQQNNAKDDSLPFDTQPLAESNIQEKKFSLADSGTALSNKISEHTGEKNITVSDAVYKRTGGAKSFTDKQVKSVKLNTSFSVQEIDINNNEQKFTATLKPVIGSFFIEVSGNYSSSVKVPVLTRSLGKGVQISQDDIELKYFPKDQISGGDVTDISTIIGKTTTKPLSEGKMVFEDDIRSPILVAKNSTVSALYKTKTIEIKALAVALDDGGEGDIIRLKNFDSGKIFKAVVQADGNVLVSAASGDINVSSNAAPEINNVN